MARKSGDIASVEILENGNRISDTLEAAEVKAKKKGKKAAEADAPAVSRIEIPAPKLQVVSCKVVGDAPLVLNRFGEKARQQLHDSHAEGSTAKSRKKREPKDFQACYESAKHVFREQDGGGYGVPAASFRNAMIDACRLAGVVMTNAKQALFVVPDGIGTDGTPLVRITGEPVYHEAPVRNASGVVDLRARPMWPEWEAVVHVRYDADLLRAQDVANLMLRAGVQVGIGEGRPFSKKSNGQGWGTFKLDGFQDSVEDDEEYVPGPK
jgi:hypothetical protein